MPRKIKKYAPGEERPKGCRADGRLSTKVVIGKDLEGKPIAKWAYGYTKAELQAAVAEIKKRYITGETSADTDVLFGVYAHQWYMAYINPASLSASAKTGYLNALNTHILPALGEYRIRAIMPITIQEFLNKKAKDGLSKSSIDKLYITLKRIFNTALGQYIIDRHPMLIIKKPDAKEGKRRALTDAERKAVLKVAESHPDGLLLSLLYYTGMRIGEVLGLQWRDIDYKNKVINVQRDIDFNAGEKVGELKSTAAYRTIPMPSALIAALGNMAGVGQAHILQGEQSGAALSQATYQRMWTRLMTAVYEADSTVEAREAYKKSGHPTKPPRTGKPGPASKPPQMRSILTPHYFRHNYATLLYDADVDLLTAIKIFGHSDQGTLLGVYTDLSKKKEAESVARLDHIF